jgi:alpha-glutamyl/putrescinyl thymine pyrophosphorylase clade 1
MNLKSVELYKTYCKTRQTVFNRRIYEPGYQDDFFQGYSFTNNYRILDRVSQYELENVIYGSKLSQSPVDVINRIFLFNQFKTVAFWENCKTLPYSSIPEFIETYSGEEKLFTSAYMVPGKKGEKKAVTILKRFKLLETYKSELVRHIDFKSINGIYKTLLLIPGISDFLASQVCFDFLWHDSTSGWEPLYQLGKGAKEGVRKLGLTGDAETAIKQASMVLTDANFPNLVVNETELLLSPSDIQNTFCEFGKVARLYLPELNGKETTVKRRYKPNEKKIQYKIPAFMLSKGSGLVSLH